MLKADHAVKIDGGRVGMPGDVASLQDVDRVNNHERRSYSVEGSVGEIHHRPSSFVVWSPGWSEGFIKDCMATDPVNTFDHVGLGHGVKCVDRTDRIGRDVSSVLRNRCRFLRMSVAFRCVCPDRDRACGGQD